MERREGDREPPHDGQGSLRGERRGIAGLLRAGVRCVGDFLMPPICLSCHRLLLEHHALCGPCWSQIHFIRPPLCDVLGLPMPFDPGGRIVSAAALADPPPFDRARAVAGFGDVMRRLVHGFKYNDRLETRRLFARWLIDVGGPLLTEADMIVPVPLHRWRLMRRQFNQAAVLGRDVGRMSGVAFEPLVLKRIRPTRSQVGLTMAQRRRNTAGAFRVGRLAAGRVTGKSVLLIDDVVTTGATVSACARALKQAGAARVDVLALAMVVRDAEFGV